MPSRPRFNPRALCGARLWRGVVPDFSRVFQSTRPVWGATLISRKAGRRTKCFNPRAPCGARQGSSIVIRGATSCFNPRAPCGARQSRLDMSTHNIAFQSTRPMRGATPACTAPPIGLLRFNPRAPCGARPFRIFSQYVIWQFQSTRPVWGATHAECPAVRRRCVSIHAPRVGRDSCSGCLRNRSVVSIHAPRVGRDISKRSVATSTPSFNPRAPCGARPAQVLSRC